MIMVLMNWDNKPSDKDWLKFTTSPGSKEYFSGAVRLLTSTDPIITVPYDNNDKVAKAAADQIEKICKAVWYQSGRINQRPVHYDLINQLVRYDEYHLAITNTQDLLDSNPELEKSSPAKRHRLEKIAEATPYLMQPLDAKSGYWEKDAFGLNAYYRKTAMTYGSMLNVFGEANLKKSNLAREYNSTDILYYHDYWDLDIHYAWLTDSDLATGGNDYLIIGKKDGGKHNLPYIPIVVQVGEASQLEDDNKYKRQPLLYAIWQASLWDRMNLELTVLYTNLFAVASNPMYVHETQIDGSTLPPVDYSRPGGVIDLNPGDRLSLLQRDVFNKDMLQGLQIAKDTFAESTMYKQALGEPLSGQQSFSTVALLSQSGRLPLVAYQRNGGWGIGTAFEVMFDLMKDAKSKRTALYLDGRLDIDPRELPEDLVIDVRLDAALPQDKLQQMNIAALGKQNGLVSTSWLRENILNIGQSADMTDELWVERFEELMMNEHFNKQMTNEIRQQVMQEMQQQQMQQQQQQAQAQAVQQRMSGASPNVEENLARQMQMRGAPQGEIEENAALGGMPPNMRRGLIPLNRPNTQPVPAGKLKLELQGGEVYE